MHTRLIDQIVVHCLQSAPDTVPTKAEVTDQEGQNDNASTLVKPRESRAIKYCDEEDSQQNARHKKG